MQIKNNFDVETLGKIGKGALLAGTGAGTIAVLQFLGTIEISVPVFASFMTWFVPFAINAVREWRKGV